MNTSRMIRACLLLGALLAQVSQTQAEDIDLFTGVNPSGGNVPTILLMMHNKTSTSASETHGCTYNDGSGAPRMGDTVTGYEQCAIVNALLAVRDSSLNGKIKVGIMVYNNKNTFASFDNGSSGAIGNGQGQCGYLAYVPKLMNTDNVNDLVTKVKSYDKTGAGNITVSATAVGDAMASAWAALNGFTDTCGGNNIDYSSIAPEDTDCGGPVIVYIGNATTSNAKAEDSTPTGRVMSLLKSQLSDKFGYAEGSANYNRFTADIPVALIDSQKDKYQADDWARFMNQVNVADSDQNDQNIRTYTIGVYDPNQGNIQDQLNYLGSMADQGGGEFYAVRFNDGQALQKVLLQIFTEVQAVNSVFSSATLPVSASTQGTYLNQVYIANFRPDRFAGPRWFGNVKQYQFAFDSSGDIVLADKNQPTYGAVAATNSASGGFSDDAHSFWTTNDPDPSSTTEWPSTTGYWVNSPNGEAGAQDAPDGNLAEKGGAAQMSRIDNLHSHVNRKVLSCSNATSCTTLRDFNTTNYGESDFSIGGSSSNTSSVTITIGSDWQYSATAPLQTMKVTYVCDNQRSCKFFLDDDSAVVFPAFFTQLGNGNNAVKADTVGIASNDVAFGACTTSTPCSVTAVGSQDQDGDGDEEPFFQIRLSSNSFKGVTRSVTLTRLQRRSQRAVVQQTAHGLSNGDPFTLKNCAPDTGGTHINASLIGSTFSETVESRISADAFMVAINGGDVAYTTGITCSGGSTATLNANLLINWVRGTDNVGNEVLEGPCPLQTNGERRDSSGNTCTMSVRPSIHGDVLHSRPAVINFGDLDNPSTGSDQDIVLFYGSNDGMFRAVNGNQARSIGGVRPGGELWSFIAPEFFGKLERQLKNYPRVAYPGIPDDEARRRDYFFDGSTSFLQDFRDAGDTAGKVYIYLTPRRGGKFIYALDVTDPTNPEFLWKRAKADFPEFGQLWSTPQVATIASYNRPVLIFGAGYDADVEDLDPAGVGSGGTAVTTDEGRGVVVLDTRDGSLVWAVLKDCSVLASSDQSKCSSNAAMTKSFAADIKLFDNDFDGNVDRLYAGDMGGNLWRIDIPTTYSVPGDWGVSKFAALGGTGENARKFLFPPDVIPSNAYDLVVGVTGDREKPLYDTRSEADAPAAAYHVDNRFYLLVDSNSGGTVAAGTATIGESDLVDRTGYKCYDPSATSIVDCSYDETDKRYEDSSGNALELVTLTQIRALKKGFYITLEGHIAANGDSEGEKGVNAPTVVAGKVYFATNQPQTSEEACGPNLGVARGYEVDFFTGESKARIYPGGGLPATTTYGLVEIDGKTVPFAIGPGETPQSPITPGISLSGKRNRTYWYYE